MSIIVFLLHFIFIGGVFASGYYLGKRKLISEVNNGEEKSSKVE
ncbi:MAG: hypothetical protein Q9M76_01700 [Candidatus Dojkabacteria bacterium]|nr:hypothetical protein [Candidatus Dojkabacteria bacterium]